jgi:hypothetical protein
MKILLVWMALSACVVPNALAQSASDYATTCATLATLTDAALRRDNRSDVMVYVNAARVIRRELNNLSGCQAEYFNKVLAQNNQKLSTSTVVLSSVTMRPVKGWTHREIDKFFTQVEAVKPSDVLGSLPIKK